MDGMPPTAVFCVIGSAVVTVKTVIRGIFEAEVLSSIDHARNTPCLIDRNKIPFKELWREANFFADEIIFAVGTDFMQKIAEAENRFICDLLNRLQQMEVVDAAQVVR